MIDLQRVLIRVDYKLYSLSMRAIIFTLLALLFINSLCIVDRTYFSYLGLKISASPEEIKEAYEQKLQKIQGLENEQQKAKKLKLLKEAYDTLSNEKQRQKYERYGKDIFKGIKELTCLNKMNPEQPKDQRKSPSFKLTIPVSIADIYRGTTVKGKFPKQTACPKCHGTGAKSPKDIKPCSTCGGKGFSLVDQQNFYGQRIQVESYCPVCRGIGKIVTKTCDVCKGSKLITKMQTVEIPIPKGLPDGNKLIFRNLGDESLIGAPSDFEVTVVEIPTKSWSRQGNNLVYMMDITLEESLFGFTKEIEHLDGQFITVNRQKQITTKETKHLVRDRGLINKQGLAGHLVVKFKVTIPQFTDQQLDMWENFFYEHPM